MGQVELKQFTCSIFSHHQYFCGKDFNKKFTLGTPRSKEAIKFYCTMVSKTALMIYKKKFFRVGYIFKYNGQLTKNHSP